MARRLGESRFALTVWARRPQSTAPFEDLAEVAPSPAALGAASDVVGICVMGDADVEEVVLRDDGVLAGMAPGGVIAIHSTVHPDTCRALAARAAGVGVDVLDAPVSGGGVAAAAGSLLVMVGGSDEATARCRPVFETFGNPVVHLGPVGSGQMAKLINNLVFTAQLSMALETFALGEDLGMDKIALGDLLSHGTGASRALAILTASGVDLSGLRAHGHTLRKDVALARDVAHQHGATEPALLLEGALQALSLLER
jgi:3-hydroxyisobutyrate dehydrogenase-like beta-hydroxyacid dehydrogenase